MCSVCRDPQHQSIDAALIAAQDSLRTLSERFGLSSSALRRHKSGHLPAALIKARERVDLGEARSLVDFVQGLQARSAALLEKAEAAGDLRAALSALRELRGIAELSIRAADRSGDTVPVSVVKAYVQKAVDVLHEFVAADRIDAALMKLQHLIESELDPHSIDAGDHEATSEAYTGAASLPEIEHLDD
jgi:hypothetical protein